MTTTSSIVPAVHGPDASILEAFQTVRQLRADNYSFDDSPTDLPQEKYDANDRAMEAAEGVIWTTEAQTIEGVSARLQLSITGLDQSRWVDRTIMEESWQALYPDKAAMSGDAAQILNAVHDLAHVHWRTVLENYETAHQRYLAFLRIRNMIEEAKFNKLVSTDVANPILRYTDEVEDSFSDHKSLVALVAAQVPDWGAYRAKAEISLREEYAEDAAPFLLRDVVHLSAVGSKLQARDRGETAIANPHPVEDRSASAREALSAEMNDVAVFADVEGGEA